MSWGIVPQIVSHFWSPRVHALLGEALTVLASTRAAVIADLKENQTMVLLPRRRGADHDENDAKKRARNPDESLRKVKIPGKPWIFLERLDTSCPGSLGGRDGLHIQLSVIPIWDANGSSSRLSSVISRSVSFSPLSSPLPMTPRVATAPSHFIPIPRFPGPVPAKRRI